MVSIIIFSFQDVGAGTRVRSATFSDRLPQRSAFTCSGRGSRSSDAAGPQGQRNESIAGETGARWTWRPEKRPPAAPMAKACALLPRPNAVPRRAEGSFKGNQHVGRSDGGGLQQAVRAKTSM